MSEMQSDLDEISYWQNLSLWTKKPKWITIINFIKEVREKRFVSTSLSSKKNNI